MNGAITKEKHAIRSLFPHDTLAGPREAVARVDDFLLRGEVFELEIGPLPDILIVAGAQTIWASALGTGVSVFYNPAYSGDRIQISSEIAFLRLVRQAVFFKLAAVHQISAVFIAEAA